MEVSPATLEFSAPFVEPQSSYLTLTNNTSKILAYKIKTTAPKTYYVRPNALTVNPGENINVAVMLQGLEAEPAADFKCRDKFLVVSIPVSGEIPQNISESWSELEARTSEKSVSTKIHVVYNKKKRQTTAVRAPPASKEANVVPLTPPPAKNDKSHDSKIDFTNNSGSGTSSKVKSVPASSSKSPISIILSLIVLIIAIAGGAGFTGYLGDDVQQQIQQQVKQIQQQLNL